MVKAIITISIDEDTLKKADEYLKNIGLGSNRSGLIQDCLKKKLELEGFYD